MKLGKNKADVGEVLPVIRRIFAENGRDYIGHYLIAIACMLAIAATTAFSAWIMRDIIDEVFYRQRWELVGWICGAIVAAFAIRGFATASSQYRLKIDRDCCGDSQ
ncbi:MAG: hypothetical protein RLO21_18860, partial [Nitratireductor sp.]